MLWKEPKIKKLNRSNTHSRTTRSMNSKLESYKPDSKVKEASFKMKSKRLDNKMKLNQEKSKSWEPTSHNFPENFKNTHQLSRNMTMLNLKLEWLLKKSKGLTEYWRKETLNYVRIKTNSSKSRVETDLLRDSMLEWKPDWSRLIIKTTNMKFSWDRSTILLEKLLNMKTEWALSTKKEKDYKLPWKLKIMNSMKETKLLEIWSTRLRHQREKWTIWKADLVNWTFFLKRSCNMKSRYQKWHLKSSLLIDREPSLKISWEIPRP